MNSCSPANGEAMGGGNGHPDTGEAARPGTDQDRRRSPAGEQIADHRHQPFAVPAANDLVSGGDTCSRFVEQGRGARRARTIEGEDHDHCRLSLPAQRRNPAARSYTASTLSTSGT